MARTGDSLFLAYTDPAEDGARVRGALVAIDDLPRATAAPRAPAGETREQAQRGGLTVGDRMPDATFHDARTGEPIALTSIDRPYVIAFFATWCEPCREEIPALRAIATEHDGGASVYSVSIDVLPREEIAAFADAQGMEHSVLVDTTHASARFGAPPLPATFVVDREGVVRFVARGVADAEELSAAVTAAR